MAPQLFDGGSPLRLPPPLVVEEDDSWGLDGDGAVFMPQPPRRGGGAVDLQRPGDGALTAAALRTSHAVDCAAPAGGVVACFAFAAYFDDGGGVIEWAGREAQCGGGAGGRKRGPFAVPLSAEAAALLCTDRAGGAPSAAVVETFQAAARALVAAAPSDGVAELDGPLAGLGAFRFVDTRIGKRRRHQRSSGPTRPF